MPPPFSDAMDHSDHYVVFSLKIKHSAQNHGYHVTLDPKDFGHCQVSLLDAHISTLFRI
jgi:glutamine synthetase